MSDTERRKLSRRSFIKATGTGLAGGGLLGALGAAPAQADRDSAAEDRGRLPLLEFEVNGRRRRLRVRPEWTLAEILRGELELTGTKLCCNRGQCGSCTVLLDDRAVYSCHMLALDAAGRRVTTVEGLSSGEELHPLQRSFLEHDGLQCGFCTPGQLMAARALLLERPDPTPEEFRRGLSGVLCRCSAYRKILDSTRAAAK